MSGRIKMMVALPKSRLVRDGNWDKNLEITIAPSSLSSLKASFRVLGQRPLPSNAVAKFRQSSTSTIEKIDELATARVSYDSGIA